MNFRAVHTQHQSGPAAIPTRDDSSELGSYLARGYAVFRNVVPRDKLAGLALSLREEFDRKSLRGDFDNAGGLMAGHLNCFPGAGSRFAFEALNDAGIIAFVARISPAFAAAPRVGCNYNLPGSVAQNWHIDGNFHRDFVIANIAVIDTDLVNGAIDLLPGSHRSPEPYWKLTARREFRAHARVEMTQGDVLVRSSRLWHRGMPNLSDAPRPMLGITFGEDCARREDPFSENDGAIGFFPNRFRSDLLGRLQERTYVKAPGLLSALRFVRSLAGKDGYT